MTNKEIAVFTLDALKKAGADHAQCVVTTGLSEEIDAENSEFTKMISLFDAGVAMKAIKDGKKGTMFINSLNEEDIIKAAEECVAAANASVVDDAVRIAELTE
ncbi:MAG TPA: TldD/PmbA family protein, partial [Clostridiales bacterium]|nr:TldD/PmbA family protein [Clostridiales bacterium]